MSEGCTDTMWNVFLDMETRFYFQYACACVLKNYCELSSNCCWLNSWLALIISPNAHQSSLSLLEAALWRYQLPRSSCKSSQSASVVRQEAKLKLKQLLSLAANASNGVEAVERASLRTTKEGVEAQAPRKDKFKKTKKKVEFATWRPQ